MEVHGYTKSRSIEVTIDGSRMTVPDVPGNRHRRMIAEWEGEGNTIPAYEPPAPEPYYPQNPAIVAAAYDVGIEDGSITGIGAGAKINAGFALDTGLYMLFFDDEQPDANFFARVWDNDAKLRCVDKDEYSITVAATDANGDPIDPETFCVEIIRVL